VSATFGLQDKIHTEGRDFRYVEAGDPYLKWSPPKKKKELFHEKSRFVLLENEDQVAAFCMFRFEAEENDEGVMEFVVYMWVIIFRAFRFTIVT
jgi:hypothetical protein